MNKNYVNAEQVLPSQLLEQVQRYAAGKLLYVPQTQEMAKLWGEGTGHLAAGAVATADGELWGGRF